VEKTNFEKLHIYKLSEQLADEIWSIVIRWESFAKETVGKQLVKAADSIGANIAEGSGRGTDQDSSVSEDCQRVYVRDEALAASCL
jgi:23S rRNA-intervening sequence protein